MVFVDSHGINTLTVAYFNLAMSHLLNAQVSGNVPTQLLGASMNNFNVGEAQCSWRKTTLRKTVWTLLAESQTYKDLSTKWIVLLSSL